MTVWTRHSAPVLAMLAVTVIWGWTFVVVRNAVTGYPVLPFLALRFTVASLALLPLLFRPGRGLRAGIVPGIILAGGYLAQTMGLRFTTASRAGLLTGLFVVLTPLMAFVILRQRVRIGTVTAGIAALLGTVLLVGVGASPGMPHELLGNFLEVVTAVLFSLHILALARFAPGLDAARLAVTQMAVAALLFSGGSAAKGQFSLPSPSVWFAIGVTGVLASAVAFWVQTAVQQRISPTRTAIILASEPAFATFFGLLLAGDHFGPSQATGAGLILAAIIGHELKRDPGPFVQSVDS